MSYVKNRFAWFWPAVVLAAALALSPNAASAAISFTGDAYTTSVVVSPPWVQPPVYMTYAYVGNTVSGTMQIDSGSTLNADQSYIGNSATGAGTATVTGSGSAWNAGSALWIGAFGGVGTLNILNGGTVSTSWTVQVGAKFGLTPSAGSITVDGLGSRLDTPSLQLGYGGTGTLDILGGGLVTVQNSTEIGLGSALDGTGLVNFGAGGGTLSTKTLYARPSDLAGTGTVSTNGLVSDVNLTFGTATGSDLSQTVSGFAGGLTVNLDMSNSANVGNLGVGYAGTGTLTVQQDIDLHSVNSFLGYKAGSSGTAVVDGAGSTWTTNSLIVGNQGNGSLTLRNGGAVSVNGTTQVAANSGATGSIAFGVGGGTLTTTVLNATAEQLSGTGVIETSGLVSNISLVFDNSSIGAGTFGTAGTLTVDMSSGNGDLGISRVSGGPATLLVQNTATVNSNNGYLGYQAGSSGAGTVTGPGSTWNYASEFYVGYEGTGTLEISNGGAVTTESGYYCSIAEGNSSAGTVTVSGSGSSWTNTGDTYVGNIGSGLLEISSGGTVSNAWGYIGCGQVSMSTVTVTGEGSTWANDGRLYVGDEGFGTLVVSNGGAVSNSSNGYLGNYDFSKGVATIDGSGSSWSNDGRLYVGRYGDGDLYVTDGGAVSNTGSYIAYGEASVSTATVSGPSSTWTNNGTLYVGYQGTGTLAIADHGTVVAETVSGDTGAMTVHFDGGTLKANADNASWIVAGSGVCNLKIQAGGATFDTQAFGVGTDVALLHGTATTDGGITKLGAGALTLSGANTYNGVTTVKEGVLALVGTSTATPIAWDPVLNGGGADLQGGKFVFNYAGGTSPAGAIATIMHDSFGTSNPFSQGNGAQIYSATADAAGMALGWMDDGVDEVTVMYTLYGDSNLDGSVNGTDLNAVLSYYNQSSEIWNHGDFNYDGSVNGTDLNTVLSNYNQSLPASTAAVPEPSTLLLMVLGLLGLLAVSRTRRVRNGFRIC